MHRIRSARTVIVQPFAEVYLAQGPYLGVLVLQNCEEDLSVQSGSSGRLGGWRVCEGWGEMDLRYLQTE